MSIKPYIGLAALFLAMPVHAGTDRCSGLLPGDLAKALELEHPDFRLPRESDNLLEDIEYRLSVKASPCLEVATADFDGNGQADFVIGMPARNTDATLIAVALRVGSRWGLDAFEMWPGSKSRVFVAVEPARRFERTEALEGAVTGSGEVLSMNCPHPAAIFGFTESSAVAYCRQGSQWKHVWVSD